MAGSGVVLPAIVAWPYLAKARSRDMPQAWWNGRKIADSDDTVVVEGTISRPIRSTATSSG